MVQIKENMRERAGNLLAMILLISDNVNEGKSVSPKHGEMALKGVQEISAWLTKSGQRKQRSDIRRKAIEKIKNMELFCNRIIENKGVSIKLAEKVVSDIEEIMEWIDQRKYITKKQS